MQERLRASGKRRSSPDPEKKKGGTWGVVTLDDGEVHSESPLLIFFFKKKAGRGA